MLRSRLSERIEVWERFSRDALIGGLSQQLAVVFRQILARHARCQNLQVSCGLH
jgi:hypothetical protein